MLSRRVIAYYGLMCAFLNPSPLLMVSRRGLLHQRKRLKVGIRVPNLLRWTVLACRLPYPGDPKSAIDCFFLFGISLHPVSRVRGGHWSFEAAEFTHSQVHRNCYGPRAGEPSFRGRYIELAPTRSPSISVEYDYVDKQSIPTAGLSPASPTASMGCRTPNCLPIMMNRHRIVSELPELELGRRRSREVSWSGFRFDLNGHISVNLTGRFAEVGIGSGG